MSKEDMLSNYDLETWWDEDLFGNWNTGCENCDFCSGDDDDLMAVFNSAERWFSNGKDEEYMFGDSEE